MGLISELRRRNVLRMAMLYVVSAWLIMQVAEVIIGLANLPAWVGPALLALLAIGFPIALIFSWFFELTAEGIKADDRPGTVTSVEQFGGRRLEYIVISLLVAAVLLFAYDKWWLGEPPEQSIAILPFENMSADPEQEYFSDGLTETLMHMLARVPDFKVAARTSSFSFKGETDDVRTIGDALGVAHILSGSVQRAGDRIRITAQLVRTDDGFDVWSERYDRDLTNIFDIQDDIANRVSNALSASLLGAPASTPIVGIATSDVDAYDLYLAAISEQAKGTVESIQASEDYLKDALVQDPDFQDARIQLASNYFQQAKLGLRSPGETFVEMIALTEQVLESRSDSTRAKALLLVGRVLDANMRGEAVDFEAATDQLRGLAAQSRSEVEPKLLLLWVLSQLNAQEEVLALTRTLLVLDPLNPEIHRDIGYAYNALGDLENARIALLRSLELEPLQPGIHVTLGTISQQEGDAVGMIRHWLDGMEADPRDEDIPGRIAVMLYQLGLIEEGNELREKVIAIAPTSPGAYRTELLKALRSGDETAALATARRMISQDVDLHFHAWEDALFTLFDISTRRGETGEALEFVEREIPGFADFPQPTPYKVGVAQFRSLSAYRQIETSDELADRVALLDYFLREVLFDEGGPIWRMETRALLGQTDDAIDIALHEILSNPAISIPDIDRIFAQHFLADVTDDVRVSNALSRWQREIAAAAIVIRSYLAESGAI